MFGSRRCEYSGCGVGSCDGVGVNARGGGGGHDGLSLMADSDTGLVDGVSWGHVAERIGTALTSWTSRPRWWPNPCGKNMDTALEAAISVSVPLWNMPRSISPDNAIAEAR